MEPRQQQGSQKKKLLEEGKEYGQILPTAEVIMKYGNDKRSLGHNKNQKERARHGRNAGLQQESEGERASQGREAVLTDPPNSGGHYEKRK